MTSSGARSFLQDAPHRARHLWHFSDEERDAAGILRGNLLLDTVVAFVEAATVLCLALWLGSTAGLFYAGGHVALNLVRTRAFRLFDRDDIAAGLLVLIFGTWAFSLPGVWLIPQGYPIHVINVISPIVLAVGYLDGYWVRRLTGAGMLYIILLGFIAFYHDGIVWAELFPPGGFEFSIIMSLTATILLFTVDVRDSNIQTLRNLQIATESSDALRMSRRRLATVADAERVRIERNIHDGAQQQLVAIALRLRLAADTTDNETHRATFETLHAQTRSALDELRELAHGVYPATLAAQGLVGTLRDVARRSANTVIVVADEQVHIDQDEQLAMYFVCLEAIQNAAKHGGIDSTTTVSLCTIDGHVQVTIADSGPGFVVDDYTQSRGILNMRDRIAVLGGDLSIVSQLGQGTTVTATIAASKQPEHA